MKAVRAWAPFLHCQAAEEWVYAEDQNDELREEKMFRTAVQPSSSSFNLQIAEGRSAWPHFHEELDWIPPCSLPRHWYSEFTLWSPTEWSVTPERADTSRKLQIKPGVLTVSTYPCLLLFCLELRIDLFRTRVLSCPAFVASFSTCTRKK